MLAKSPGDYLQPGHRLLCEEVVHTASLNIIFLRALTVAVFAPSLIRHEIAQAGQSNMFALLSRGAEGVIPQIARSCAWSLWRLEGIGLASALCSTEGDGGSPTLSLAPGQILGVLCKASPLLSNSCSSTGLVFWAVVSLISLISLQFAVNLRLSGHEMRGVFNYIYFNYIWV